MKRPFLKTLLVAAAATAMGPALAQEKVIKFANQNAEGHPIIQGMQKFAEQVEAKSNGALKVKVFPSGQLGSDQANVSALQGGTLEMAAMNSGIFASQVKSFAVFDLPFVFANGQEADAVVDGPFGQKLHALLADKRMVGLGYYELGFRQITNSKRPITRVDEIAGLKLRVIPNPINLDWVKALGGNPTPLPFPELYAALEQKAVDGQENPVATIWGAKLFEVQKYMTMTNHQYNPQSVVISRKFWDKLSPDEQKIIQDAVTESVQFQRQQARAAEAGTLEKLQQAGMTITELADDQKAAMVEKMKPVIDKNTASIGKETVDELMAALARARQ